MELYCTDGSKCHSTGCSQTHQVCRENGYVRSEAVESLRAQLTALQAQLEAAEKDAARYRWLRDAKNLQGSAFIDGTGLDPLCDTRLDSAIDAALAQNGKE